MMPHTPAAAMDGIMVNGTYMQVLARSSDQSVWICCNETHIASVHLRSGATNVAPSPGNVLSAKFSQDHSNTEVVLDLCDRSVLLDVHTMCEVESGEESFLLPCDPPIPATSSTDPQYQSKSSKIFVGGLNPCTTDEELSFYFSQFGTVLSSKVIFSRDTGNSRRFGFAVFEDVQVANAVCQKQNHEIRGYKIETRLAIPSGKLRKSGTNETSKESSRLSRQIFVGGLPTEVTPSTFREWAEHTFPGRVVNAVLVVDRLTHTKSRGFGFVTFDSSEMVEFASSRVFPFDDKLVEVKKAENMTSSGGLKNGGSKEGSPVQFTRNHLPASSIPTSQDGSGSSKHTRAPNFNQRGAQKQFSIPGGEVAAPNQTFAGQRQKRGGVHPRGRGPLESESESFQTYYPNPYSFGPQVTQGAGPGGSPFLGGVEMGVDMMGGAHFFPDCFSCPGAFSGPQSLSDSLSKTLTKMTIGGQHQVVTQVEGTPPTLRSSCEVAS